MRDDSVPARHGTKCGEFVQCRLGVNQHQVAGLDQGPPREYVIGEDRLMRQHVVRSPYEMHAKHPADPQHDKEPGLCHPSHGWKTSCPREGKGENPVEVQHTCSGETPGRHLKRQEQKIECLYRRQLTKVGNAGRQGAASRRTASSGKGSHREEEPRSSSVCQFREDPGPEDKVLQDADRAVGAVTPGWNEQQGRVEREKQGERQP